MDRRRTFVADSLAQSGDADVTHVVSLRVTDSADVESSADTVTITVTPGFKAPVADAGPDQDNIVPGATVSLDGSGSSVDRRRTIKSWAWTSETATLTGATTATPSFVAESPAPGAADVIHVVSLRVTDDADDVSEPDTVTITVISGFKAPVADAGPDQDNIVPGATVSLDGSGSSVDRRRTIKSWAWTSDTATLTGATTETPSFVADSLDPGDADVTHVVSLRVTDSADVESSADTVTITVTPGFKAPVADAGPDQDNIVPGATVSLDGSGSMVDRRRTIKSWEWTSETATLTGATTETPTFVADSLDHGDADVTHVVSLRVTDSADVESSADTVTITVIPGFKVPVADAGPDQDNIVPGATVSLDGSGSSVDRRRTIKSWAWTSETATLTGATTETPSFVADSLDPGDADVTHVVSLRVTDSADVESSADTVTITVIPGFKAPVADAGPDQDNIVPGATVSLDGSGSSVDRRRNIKSWAWTSETATLTGATTETPSFVADSLDPGDADVTHVVSLRVTDSADVESSADTVTITVIPGFKAPVADAGPDQDNIVPGATVSLDGSGSSVDRRRNIKSWEWTSETATLTGATTETPSFVAESPAPGAADVIHVVSLRVTDDADDVSEPDTVTITVIPDFKAPVADAGPDQDNIVPGATVSLDGSGSMVDRRRNIKSWEWTSETATLTGATTETPSFVAESPAPGAADVIHVVSLRVTDDADDVSEPDTVTITVIPDFKAPVADAGPDQDNIVPGATVSLDGSGSSVDRRRNIKSWEWTSETATLTGATTETPSFVAESPAPGDADVTHVVSLRVTDSADVESSADTVTITVIPGFKAPVADAGPDQDNIVPGATVSLDGSGSSVDRRRTIKSWAWASETATLTGATTATPTFVADSLDPGDADVTHVVSLRVTDSADVESSADTVTITVIPGFKAPVAHAGPDQDAIVPGTTVTLDGSASTVDRRRTFKTWAWKRLSGSGDSNIVLTNANTAAPTFTADTLEPGVANATHVFELIVTDSADVESSADTVTITVIPDFKTPISNVRPVADAGEDQKVASRTTVTLDGSKSTDRDGVVESWSWRRTAGTGGDIVVLANENTPQMRFTADTIAPGADDVTHIFELIVTDNEGAVSEPDTVTVTVSAAPLLKVGIVVSRSELTVQEGESSAYQVRLSRSPNQDVTIEAVSDNEDVVLNNAQLLFNAGNWSTWQNFSISTVADTDKVDDKALIRHTFVGSGLAVGQSGVVSVTVREVDPVLTPVGEYLATRATALLNKQRKLIPFLKQDGTIPGESKNITLNVTNDRFSLDGGFVRDGIWGEVTGSYTRGDYGDLKSVLGSFGIHWKNSEHFLTGVMLQFDLAENDLAGRAGSIDGAGWLAGPYFAARHGTQPLYFEGRLLYGQSDNDIRFMDTGLGVMRTGSFDTKRLLAQVRLEGEIAMSDLEIGPRLIPYADARWIEDRAQAFTDNIGNRVPGQKVSIGQLELGSNIEVPIAVRTGEMTFTGGLGLVWSNTEGDYITSDSGGRGRGEIGFSYGLDETLRIVFESFYDGIGSSRYENYGLSLSAEMKF